MPVSALKPRWPSKMDRSKVFVDDGELESAVDEIENSAAFVREQVSLLVEENARLWWKAHKLGEYAADLRKQLKRRKHR